MPLPTKGYLQSSRTTWVSRPYAYYDLSYPRLSPEKERSSSLHSHESKHPLPNPEAQLQGVRSSAGSDGPGSAGGTAAGILSWQAGTDNRQPLADDFTAKYVPKAARREGHASQHSPCIPIPVALTRSRPKLSRPTSGGNYWNASISKLTLPTRRSAQSLFASGIPDMSHPAFKHLTVTSPDPTVYIITMQKPPENRLTVAFAQTIISALRYIEATIGPGKPGCVVIEGSDAKFWCTGVDLEESTQNPFASNDGFYPLLATLVDYPFPTIALLTGHTFGGAGPFSLSCDYRIMNSERGFWCMPPVNLGLHFDGIGALVRLKLPPQIARRVLLEAHRFTGTEALQAGIVDEIAKPSEMREVAIRLARQHAHRATMGVYSLLRNELWGEGLEKFRRVSYAHGKRPTVPRVKI